MPRNTIPSFAQNVRDLLQREDARFDLLLEAAGLISYEDGYPSSVTSSLEDAAAKIRQVKGWNFCWFEPGDEGFAEDA